MSVITYELLTLGAASTHHWGQQFESCDLYGNYKHRWGVSEHCRLLWSQWESQTWRSLQKQNWVSVADSSIIYDRDLCNSISPNGSARRGRDRIWSWWFEIHLFIQKEIYLMTGCCVKLKKNIMNANGIFFSLLSPAAPQEVMGDKEIFSYCGQVGALTRAFLSQR